MRDRLTSQLPEEFIEDRASELGAVERERTIDVVVLVWVLVLAWTASAERTIASLRRSYMWAAGHVVACSSFYGRLSEPLLRLLKECTEGLLGRVAQRACSYHGHALEHFEDILAVDTTIIRLNDMLSDSFPGCFEGVASAKLDIVMKIAEATPRRLTRIDHKTYKNRTVVLVKA